MVCRCCELVRRTNTKPYDLMLMHVQLAFELILHERDNERCLFFFDTVDGVMKGLGVELCVRMEEYESWSLGQSIRSIRSIRLSSSSKQNTLVRR
jgi:hypothetical protein